MLLKYDKQQSFIVYMYVFIMKKINILSKVFDVLFF